MAGSEEMGFIPPTDIARYKGKGPMNPFATGLECNQKLVYLFENPQGALIYRDANGQFLAKTLEHPTTFQRDPWVNFQGDICIGEDGAWYVVTKQPKLIDALGLLKLNEEASISFKGSNGAGISEHQAAPAQSRPDWQTTLGMPAHPPT